MNTLLLDPVTWDLTLDAFGNIAVASDPLSVAQDASSAIRTFQRECWYNTTLGIPFFSTILGKRPPLSVIKAQLTAAAMTVPGAANAVCYIASIADRNVVGQVQIADINGNTSAAGFST